jgi:hypothetical protein
MLVGKEEIINSLKECSRSFKKVFHKNPIVPDALCSYVFIPEDQIAEEFDKAMNSIVKDSDAEEYIKSLAKLSQEYIRFAQSIIEELEYRVPVTDLPPKVTKKFSAKYKTAYEF